MEGSPPQYLLNPFASIRSSRRWRVETKRIICLFKLLRRLGTCVIWGGYDGSHPSRMAVRWHPYLGSVSRWFVPWNN